MQIVTLSIGGMSCGHCVRSVRAALEAVPDATVRDVRVGAAEVALGASATPDALLAAVQDAGYDAVVAGTSRSTPADAAPAADAGCACCAPAPAGLARAAGTARQ